MGPALSGGFHVGEFLWLERSRLCKSPEAGSPRVWRDLQRAYFDTFRFTVCMNLMNARNLLGMWARLA
jgi:hypothetical protein